MYRRSANDALKNPFSQDTVAALTRLAKDQPPKGKKRSGVEIAPESIAKIAKLTPAPVNFDTKGLLKSIACETKQMIDQAVDLLKPPSNSTPPVTDDFKAALFVSEQARQDGRTDSRESRADMLALVSMFAPKAQGQSAPPDGGIKQAAQLAANKVAAANLILTRSFFVVDTESGAKVALADMCMLIEELDDQTALNAFLLDGKPALTFAEKMLVKSVWKAEKGKTPSGKMHLFEVALPAWPGKNI